MDTETVITRMATSIKAFSESAEEAIIGNLEFWSEHADDVCESEIEKVFLLAWIAKLIGFEHFGAPDGGDAKWYLSSPADIPTLEAPTFVDPVRQIDLIKGQFHTCGYRTDFALRRFINEGGSYINASPIVLVECDGHDFHERTKEQAARDKERDRMLQTEGFYVLRFTGSEVWRDPARCAEQVNDFIDGHMDRAHVARRRADKL